jgi:hypothetical protein
LLSQGGYASGRGPEQHRRRGEDPRPLQVAAEPEEHDGQQDQFGDGLGSMPVSSQKMCMALASASPTNKPARIHHARVCVAWQPAEHSVDRRPDQQTRHVEHGVDAGDDGWGMHG